jgi:caa(3)-type oxidase subunit IV
METKAHAKRPYLAIFISLAVLTGIEVAIAGLAFEPALRVFVLLGLAAFKAALVALFYMHLRYDHRLLAVIGGFPLLLVLVMLIILMVDRVVQS